MSKKYTQIVEVAALKKALHRDKLRPEPAYHEQEDALEEVFHTKMAEFDQALIRLKTGWETCRR